MGYHLLISHWVMMEMGKIGEPLTILQKMQAAIFVDFEIWNIDGSGGRRIS